MTCGNIVTNGPRKRVEPIVHMHPSYIIWNRTPIRVPVIRPGHKLVEERVTDGPYTCDLRYSAVFNRKQ